MPKFKVGDQVKTVQTTPWLSAGEEGIIVAVGSLLTDQRYTVKFNDGTGWSIAEDDLELASSVHYLIDDTDSIAELPTGLLPDWLSDGTPATIPPYRQPKCECGVSTVGSGMHSTWCPIKDEGDV